ncbi:MAG: UvrD-helicase domain-containing protein, partial [Clostridia bacterium]|nr:UvrD-helicase domain-containing protein [Clostridia bacterium]
MENNVMTTEYQSALKKLFDRYYSHLNERQREVVYTTEGPLLVLAGAGTGKTRVLTHRISHLLTFGNAPYGAVCGDNADKVLGALGKDLSDEELSELLRSVTSPACRPYEVLAITFTNKAAGEIKSRLVKLLGEEAVGEIWSGTFHSVCVRILRAH